ncbi:MAG: PAS domain S-box protein [Pseudohongiella sp.]|nr:PAS domain S-box protein [Pseudohongiella sp.]
MNQSIRNIDEEEFHLDLLTQSIDLIWRASPEGEFTFLSPSLKTMTGFDQEDLLHKSMHEWAPLFLAEESIRMAASSLQKREQGFFGNDPLKFDLVFKRKDGSEFVGEMRTAPILNSNGETIAIQGTTRDVTEQRRAVKELEKSRELFLLFFQLSNDPCAITDSFTGEIVDVNPAWISKFGWTREAAVGKSLADLNMFPQSSQKEINQTLAEVYGNDSRIECKITLRTQSGEERVCLLECRTVEVAGIQSVFTLIDDITDREKLEEERIRHQRLESLGMFAGGIAHEVNNALTAVVGNLSLAKLTENQAERNLFLEKSEAASLHVKTIAQQLLTFSKGGDPARELLDLEGLLRKAVASTLHDSDIGAEFFIEKDLWQVQVDREQIIQVIHNLIINGRQAMPGGGRLVVSAKNIQINPGTKYSTEPGCYVQISIGDQGTGIDPVNRPKIFDPFYTTKKTGKGLGLAVSYSIIQKHHGHITFVSEVDAGSTFSFLLPAEQNRAQVELETKKIQLKTGKGKILVMDDSESIQSLMKAMLSRLGYEVVITSDGGEAIEKYKAALSQSQSFVAVILDLTVPDGIGGQEALQTLLEIDPQVKAIVASGYSNNDVLAHYQDYGFLGSIPKPFRLVELGAELDKVLRGP